tara:strand:- start:3119 stop:5092 length:1974 start_codon:yes stop_codon:yes gene_type:complete
MIKISQTDDKLVIKSDDLLVVSPRIKNWLISQEVGFVLTQTGSSQATYESQKINDVKFLQRVYKFLNAFEIEIDLDTKCKEILDKIEQETKDFEKRTVVALKMKKNPKDIPDFDVPRMQDGKKLKWYQKLPVMHGITLENSANFSIPGSGKTWMAYSVFFILKQKGIVDKLLVVSPLAAFKPWEAEYKEITGKDGNILRLTGTRNERLLKFQMIDGKEIFLANYTTAGIEKDMITNLLLKNYKVLMVVDESHNIKNFGTQRTQSIMDLGMYAKRRMILTGTMMPRKLNDVWTQFQFLYPERTAWLIGSRSQFEKNSEELGAIEKYSEKLAPYFTRISEDMLELPPVEFNPTNNGNPHVVEMGDIQRRIYNAVKGRIASTVKIEEFRDDTSALIDYVKKAWVYLIEISIDPALIKHNPAPDSPELEALHMDALELLEKYPRLKNEPHAKYKKTISLAKETLEKGGKVIVWTNFLISAKKLGDYFSEEGYKSVTITGAVPKDDDENGTYNRELLIENFKTDSEINVLIAIPASLAESVSLHKHCHHAIYVDRTYNGGHYMQSLKRIHRVETPNVTTRYDIIESEDSIDQEIAVNLGIKKRDMDAFYNNAELHIQDLRGAGDSSEESNEENYNNLTGNDDEFGESLKGILDHVSNDDEEE